MPCISGDSINLTKSNNVGGYPPHFTDNEIKTQKWLENSAR